MRKLLETILQRSVSQERYIVAVAGPPGAGKSTLAIELTREISSSEVLQMDGFHYDNAVLDKLGLRARKGAPETFDYQGFSAALKRIRNQERDIAVPVFDRTLDLARGGAALIAKDTGLIVVEGNYLLLNEPPWDGLREYFDLTVFLDIPRPELYRRLMQRWLNLGRTPEEAEHWVTSNDLPNVDRVLSNRLNADIICGAF